MNSARSSSRKKQNKTNIIFRVKQVLKNSRQVEKREAQENSSRAATRPANAYRSQQERQHGGTAEE